MQIVTFARAVPPYQKGSTRVVPDDVALKLMESGDVSASADWPSAAEGKAPEKPRRPVLNLKRPSGTSDRRMTR